MAIEIRQSQLRNDNAVIMRRVADGESFVVTVNGRPIADVTPHQRDTGRRRFVPIAAAVAALNETPMSTRGMRQWWHEIREDADEPEDPWQRQAGRQ